MKHLFFFLSICIAVHTSDAQWTDISGQIPGNILTVGVNQSNHMFASTDQYRIYRSTDNGMNWIKLDFPEIPVNKFSFISSQEVFASGEYGTLYYSSDNGSNWELRASGIKSWDIILCIKKTTSGKLLAGAYTDCLSCNGGGIYESTNNGITWNFITLLNNHINDIVVDNNFIYAAAYQGVYRSGNDGLTWQLKNSGMQNYEFIKYISLGPINAIFAAVDIYGGKMYKSTDQGEQWIQIASGLPEDEVTGLTSYTNYTFVSYKNAGIYRLTGDEITWLNTSYLIDPYETLEYNALTKNNSNILLIATSGGIFVSEYNGEFWDKITFSISHTIISSAIKTEGGNIIVGTENGGLYISNDLGMNWNQILLFSPEHTYSANHLRNGPDGKLFAAFSGLIYRSLYMSTNQGVTWTHRGPSLQYGINSLHVDDNNRIIIGEYKKIYFSSDFGTTWTSTTIDEATSQIFSIATKSNNLVFAGTYHNGIFRSTNNGNNFSFSGIPNGQVYSLVVDSIGYIYAGCSPNLYRSTDDGISWEIINEGMGVATVRDLKLLHGDTLLAATSRGFYFSANKGEYWNQLNDGLSGTITRTLATDDDGQIYCGTTNGLFKLLGPLPVELISFTVSIIENNIHLNWVTATETNNKGFEVDRSKNKIDWENIGFKQGKGTTTEQQSYSFKDNLSGNNPTKIYYRLKQIDFDGSFEYSDVVEVDIAAPSFSLSQNYPNPFNPVTTIKYSIPNIETHRDASLQIVLKVFDILGREVATLINEVKQPGVYEVEFNLKSGNRNLASGIYYYQLKAGDFIETKKMIFLK